MFPRAAWFSLLVVLGLLVFLHYSHVSAGSTAGSPLGGVWLPGSAGFKRLVIYYGWLNTSNLLGLDFDVLVASGTSRVLPGGPDYPVLEALRSRGVEVYLYLHDADDQPLGLGSSFRVAVYENSTGSLEERLEYWESLVEKSIDRYVGVADGVFFDECDASYFTENLSDPMVRVFSEALRDLVAYAHRKGLKVFINGVMGYAGYGDYYLWEIFVVGYNWSTGSYYLVPGFLDNTTTSVNPLDWVNGMPRYSYLRSHGLLNRTFAVTFVDPLQPETLEWGRLAYALARIMGLAGWGVAPVDYYADGGPVPLDAVPGLYEYGPRVRGPSIGGGRAEAWFAWAGRVAVDYAASAVSYSPATSPGWHPRVDGSPSEYWLRGPFSGSSTTIEAFGFNATSSGLYLYARIVYASPIAPGSGLVQFYVDSDGDSSTGYQVAGIGADYMVEVASTGYPLLYKYTGDGASWEWQAIGSVWFHRSINGTVAVVEAVAPAQLAAPGVSRVAAVSLAGWEPDASTPAYTVNRTVMVTPMLFEPCIGCTRQGAVIVEAYASPTAAWFTGEAPGGVLANYTLYLPFSPHSVYAGNRSLPRLSMWGGGEGYTARSITGGVWAVSVYVRHSSPVTVRLYASPSVGGYSSMARGMDGGLAAAAGAATILVAALLAVWRRLTRV